MLQPHLIFRFTLNEIMNPLNDEKWANLTVQMRETGKASGGFGGLVWGSAVLLAQYLFLHKEEFSGKRCLELGAGCGLTGIFAAFLCQSVVLTDMWPEVLANLKLNVETAEKTSDANSQDFSPCSVLPFNWKDSLAFMAGKGGSLGKFDVILGADVVTQGFSGRLLAKSIATCLSDDGIFYGVSPVERCVFVLLDAPFFLHNFA